VPVIIIVVVAVGTLVAVGTVGVIDAIGMSVGRGTAIGTLPVGTVGGTDAIGMSVGAGTVPVTLGVPIGIGVDVLAVVVIDDVGPAMAPSRNTRRTSSVSLSGSSTAAQLAATALTKNGTRNNERERLGCTGMLGCMRREAFGAIFAAAQYPATIH
jgi:hypothetical protein